mmetsp:Transcript_36241/g.71617  ORF Transcript_36241/g.71617 Transcript_36241/m.71617 type:complete len:83 (-) Transcript_36241:9-257(-)
MVSCTCNDDLHGIYGQPLTQGRDGQPLTRGRERVIGQRRCFVGCVIARVVFYVHATQIACPGNVLLQAWEESVLDDHWVCNK